MPSHSIDNPVQFIKGVGPQRARLLSRLGIETIRDLLGHFPREYEDRRQPVPVATLRANVPAVICGIIQAVGMRSLTPKLAVFSVAVRDASGMISAVFFRTRRPYATRDVFASLKNEFTPERTVYLSGTTEYAFGELQFRVDDYEFPASPEAPPAPLARFNRIMPIYPLTAGISQHLLRTLISGTLGAYGSAWPEIVPGTAVSSIGMTAREALLTVHAPPDFAAAERARRRLAYDEFLLFETALAVARNALISVDKPQHYSLSREILTPFREHLGFDFTPAQKRVINEIFTDLRSSKPMNRLLLGDVGSGKTVVALSAALLARESGFQSVVLAPTEILAEQHYRSMQSLLKGLPVTSALLTAHAPARRGGKQALRQAIAAGTVDIVVGTHAVLHEQVAFKSLRLVVIDEQHRFGVLQRAALQQKADHPDVLIMTATPIPRTLALTLYGDMDVSIIDQLPPGRQPIETLHLTPAAAYAEVISEVRAGRQAFIVYPLVEESDQVALKAAVQEAATLSRTVFCDVRVAVLHGQLRTEEKERIMDSFRRHESDILIATTVVEVGIDVPNASIMVIEHAERFGLATLHQLRGRIGRGSARSRCILIGVPKTPEARRRIDIMLASQNGFTIAEQDLALRGPGEFLGTAQHGLLLFKAGNILSDLTLLEQARAAAMVMVANDPALAAPGHASLREALHAAYHGRLKLLRIA